MWYQPRSHGDEPFPWVGICLGAGLGVVIDLIAAWIFLELYDGGSEFPY